MNWSSIDCCVYSAVKLGHVHPDSVVESRWVGILGRREVVCSVCIGLVGQARPSLTLSDRQVLTILCVAILTYSIYQQHTIDCTAHYRLCCTYQHTINYTAHIQHTIHYTAHIQHTIHYIAHISILLVIYCTHQHIIDCISAQHEATNRAV